jgi:ethanolamine utilization microcompartment shell protein EutL
VLRINFDTNDLWWATAAAGRLEATGMTLAKAVEIAEAETHGTAYEVALGRNGIEVQLLAGHNKAEVKIGVEDGRVVTVIEEKAGFRSAEDDDDDSGHHFYDYCCDGD